MKANEEKEVPGKWEKTALILAVVFFIVAIIFAAYAIAMSVESGKLLFEDHDEWQVYWAEREGLWITVRTLGVLFFMLSMGLVALWVYLRRTRTR